MVRPSLRTRSVRTKLTDAEYASLERQAEASGKTLSAWCRDVMLASVNGQAPKNQQSVDTEVQAVMAELVALRKILLNVLFKQANGQPLTAQEMQGLIDRADSDKLKKARERLAQAAQPEMQPEGKS